MSGKTPNFGLGYFDFKDAMDSSLSVKLEVERFLTIDSQLSGLYSIFGNGIVNGLIVSSSVSDVQVNNSSLSINISPGTFFLMGRSVELTLPATLTDIPSNSEFFIFVNFTRSLNTILSANIFAQRFRGSTSAVRLAKVVTSRNSISSIDLSYREEISFRQMIIDEIAKHKHRGEPDRIDLSREVKNTLPGARISDLDTAKIKRGLFKKERIPKLDHNNLKNKGFIGHAQLETFARTIPDINRQLLGEVASVNLMRQNLFNIRNTPDIASESVNMVSVIPGITNNALIDFDASTAIINLASSCITGVPEEAGSISLIKYNTVGALQQYLNRQNISFTPGSAFPPIGGTGEIVPPPFGDSATTGSASISIITSSGFGGNGGSGGQQGFKDSFENPNAQGDAYPGLFISTEPIPDSTTYGASPDNSLRTDGIYSVKLRGGKKEKLLFKRSVLINRNWSEYANINVDVRCKESPHPPVYFYFINKNDAGVLEQSDVFNLLNENEITVNSDPSKQDFITKSFDIIALNRGDVQQIVFEVADVEIDFRFNVDNIGISGFVSGSGGSTVVVQSYKESGILLYRYQSNNLINLNSIFYDVLIPSGTAIEFRYRSGNSITEISQENFSDPVLSEQYVGAIGKIFDIQIFFKAKKDEELNLYVDTPFLYGFSLQISSSGEESGYVVSKLDQWLDGKGENVEIKPTVADLANLTIRSPLEINNYYYATENTIQKSNNNFISYFGYVGLNLPISPNQAIEIEASDGARGLDSPTSVYRMANKNLLICDTYNDRVVEIDQNGNLVRGFGSHYSASVSGFFPLSACYNPNTGILQILFNAVFDIDETTFQMSSIKLVSGNTVSSLTSLDTIVSAGISKRIINIKLSSSKKNFISSSTGSLFVRLVPSGFGQENGFTQSQTFTRLYGINGLELFVGNFTYIDNIKHPVSAIKSQDTNWYICNSNLMFDRLRAGLRNDNDEFFVGLNDELKFTLIVDPDDSIRAQDHKITFLNDQAEAGSNYIPVSVIGPVTYEDAVSVTTKSKYTAEVITTPTKAGYVPTVDGTTFLLKFKIKVEVKDLNTNQYVEVNGSPFFQEKRMTVVSEIEEEPASPFLVPSVIKLDTYDKDQPLFYKIIFNFGSKDTFAFSDYTLGAIHELDSSRILIGGLQKFAADQQPPSIPDDPDSFEGQAIVALAPYRGRAVVYDTELGSIVYSYDSSDGMYVSDISVIFGGELTGSFLIAESTIETNGGRIIALDNFGNIVKEINTGEYTIINDARFLANGNFLLST
jgi:hypothetical protein